MSGQTIVIRASMFLTALALLGLMTVLLLSFFDTVTIGLIFVVFSLFILAMVAIYMRDLPDWLRVIIMFSALGVVAIVAMLNTVVREFVSNFTWAFFAFSIFFALVRQSERR